MNETNTELRVVLPSLGEEEVYKKISQEGFDLLFMEEEGCDFFDLEWPDFIAIEDEQSLALYIPILLFAQILYENKIILCYENSEDWYSKSFFRLDYRSPSIKLNIKNSNSVESKPLNKFYNSKNLTLDKLNPHSIEGVELHYHVYKGEELSFERTAKVSLLVAYAFFYRRTFFNNEAIFIWASKDKLLSLAPHSLESQVVDYLYCSYFGCAKQKKEFQKAVFNNILKLYGFEDKELIEYLTRARAIMRNSKLKLPKGIDNSTFLQDFRLELDHNGFPYLLPKI